jgi:hypothetical protein
MTSLPPANTGLKEREDGSGNKYKGGRQAGKRKEEMVVRGSSYKNGTAARC